MEESYSGKFVLFLFRFPDEIEPMSVELCWMQLLYVRASWGYNFFFFFFFFFVQYSTSISINSLSPLLLHICAGMIPIVELGWLTAEEDAQLIPAGMSNDCIAQSWFRFLHCLGNPANLCRPAVISQTQKFLQFAITSENVIDPCQHPCLAALPLIFLKAIKGIAGQVDAFLGKV
jgi:hypothetical protein